MLVCFFLQELQTRLGIIGIVSMLAPLTWHKLPTWRKLLPWLMLSVLQTSSRTTVNVLLNAPWFGLVRFIYKPENR